MTFSGSETGMELDFHRLAEETFDLSRQIEDQKVEAQQQNTLEEEMDHLIDVQEEFLGSRFPATCGLFFRIDRGTRTFCLRGQACSNIADTYGELKKGDFDALKPLKLSPDEVEEEWGAIDQTLMSFPTEDLALAEVLADTLFNRRFPLDEDALCNIADPGFSWWLGKGSDALEIHFKSHGLDRAERFTRLGPMGDQVVAQKRLGELENFLKSRFAIAEFSVGASGLKITPQNSKDEEFLAFVNLFQTGEMPYEENDMRGGGLSPARAKTQALYLRELAALRRLWGQLEENFR